MNHCLYRLERLDRLLLQVVFVQVELGVVDSESTLRSLRST